jgi:hypothetical protein
MKKNNSNAIPQFASLEAEKEYWEAKGLLDPHRPTKTSSTKGVKRASFLNIRLSGEEITELRDLAARAGMGPSTFTRTLIKNSLAQNQTAGFRDYSRVEGEVLMARDGDRIATSTASLKNIVRDAGKLGALPAPLNNRARDTELLNDQPAALNNQAQEAAESSDPHKLDLIALVDLGSYRIDPGIVSALFETLRKTCHCALLSPQDQGYAETQRLMRASE